MALDAIIAAYIGQPHEPGGLVLVERIETLTGEFDGLRKRWNTETVYRVRQIERPEPGTRLTDVADRVGELCSGFSGGRLTLLVNVTACGRPPVDLLIERRLKPIPIISTQSDVARRGKGSVHVPAKEMVSSLSILMAERRLQAPRDAANADTLAEQLREFRAKPKPKPTNEPWRQEETGELVGALMMAVWWGETRLSSLLKQPPPPREAPKFRGWTFSDLLQRSRRARLSLSERI
jgi:hypothetical protein